MIFKAQKRKEESECIIYKEKEGRNQRRWIFQEMSFIAKFFLFDAREMN